ncbi:hypothetical protein BGZ83_009099 [Gryganskiella cystojenkinii]|nr:hypothetical protein BGZ83_009099 [Gryganskiella cystojenkinii]
MTDVEDNTPQTAEDQLWEAFVDILREPFMENYEDKWEEEPYWAAVEVFKVKSKEIGFEDPFVFLSQFRIESYEVNRDKLKAGPPACFREGWVSPILGQKFNTLALIQPLEHLSGNKFEGKERIVVLDFWATWCGPCVQSAPELSELAEKHAGTVAILGINNEQIFRAHENGIAEVKTFLEKNKKTFRYTVYADTAEHHVRDAIYKPSEYKAVPCVVLLVDGVVSYAGPPHSGFTPALAVALEQVPAKEE